jgi:hypothetical protein
MLSVPSAIVPVYMRWRKLKLKLKLIQQQLIIIKQQLKLERTCPGIFIFLRDMLLK